MGREERRKKGHPKQNLGPEINRFGVTGKKKLPPQRKDFTCRARSEMMTNNAAQNPR